MQVVLCCDLPQENVLLAHATPPGRSLREVEGEHILNVLNETGGNYSETARILGISRVTLYSKIKAYGLTVKKMDST